MPKKVIPGGVLAALKDVGTGGKASTIIRTVTVQLEAQESSAGSCPTGATSEPTMLNLRMVDDDDQIFFLRNKAGLVCTAGEPTNAKFWARYSGPMNCKDSAVPTGNQPSAGNLFLTATTADGVLEVVRNIVCKR